ncbi:uncharacterized protein LOC141632554 [Silene latifolia]|uniref:uncharacterized protein LOC141632554 n=1 Tax=Silene latifolia TaxID=37657 RepID=UPI003D776BD5
MLILVLILRIKILEHEEDDEEPELERSEVLTLTRLWFKSHRMMWLPVIVNEWRPETELIKHDVKIVPIWMKIYGLDVKFWGQESLKKISGVVGKFVKSDDATTHRNFLGFARLLVEVEIVQQFPHEINFLDEHGKSQIVKVVYDWIPVSCTTCKGMGHVSKDCWKGTGKMNVKQKVKSVTKVPDKSVVHVVTVTPVAPRVVMTPVIVQKTPTVESSIPRRLITKLMRTDKGEKRSFPPGGVSFMEALSSSFQRSRIDFFGLVEKGETSKLKDNGLHKGGKIWLIWDPHLFEVDVCDVTIQCIHSKIVDKARKVVFWFTVVYGLNHHNEIEDLWNSLRSYHGSVDGPWIVRGDFNSIMASDERIGGAPVTNAEVRPMLQTVQDCKLADLSGQGAFYTWSNKHDNETRVYSRIDRVFVNDDWVDTFPESYVHFMPEGWFDHCPGLVQFDSVCQRKGTTFKYFNMWSLAPEYKHIVEAGWHKAVQGTPMFRFQESLALDPLNEQILQNERACAHEVSELRKARAQFLSQKAKCDWIKMGDENTSYFHARIKKRRARNSVFQVRDMNNNICSSPESIQQAFEDLLTAPITSEEVKKAMFDIPGDKAPGPDGYSSQFFNEHWDIVGPDIVAAVKGAFSSGKLLKQVNSTIITLIPKVEMPETVLQFRPIACCNTVYKCLSKVICARLGKVLPDIISSSQSAFIKGRDIVGNILICQDLIKLYKRKSCSPKLMMKLDLQKAYDSVEWSFVRDMLTCLGFPERFLWIVMECVMTPTYTISLNGANFGFFHGMRGLRQGDPPSPLLGDRDSSELILRAFKYFSNASGLIMNRGKSNFYCNGVDEAVIKHLEHHFGMKRGTVPFKYLGVNVTPKRLSIMDCDCLVEKIVEKIRGFGARKLSYAGRMVLIKAVLSNIHRYWARIFILPKAVIKKIEVVCRNYLWHGSENKDTPALVSWDQICHKKKHGGLGLKDLHAWNVAAIRKYVWWVAMKADHLWVRWVHAIYIKSKTWEGYEPANGTSWMISEWCLMQLPITDCIQWWVKWKVPELSRKKIIAVIIASLMAHIWFSRNKCRIEDYVIRPAMLCRMVKLEVKNRLASCGIKSRNRRVLDWVLYIQST